MSKFTDFLLRADTESEALTAAEQAEGYDLAVRDEETNTLRWNKSPAGGASAFSPTRGPVTGYEEGPEGEQVPVYADGFFALLRVRSDRAEAIQQLIDAQEGIEMLPVEQAQARFAGGDQ